MTKFKDLPRNAAFKLAHSGSSVVSIKLDAVSWKIIKSTNLASVGKVFTGGIANVEVIPV